MTAAPIYGKQNMFHYKLFLTLGERLRAFRYYSFISEDVAEGDMLGVSTK